MPDTLSRRLPLAAVRTLALHAQRLTTPNGAEPDPAPDFIFETVAQLGCVQIDTLQMVQRSHYLALWSRLGAYDTADFDRLVYKPGERRLFEYWWHAACIIPYTAYSHCAMTMNWFRDRDSGRSAWGNQPDNIPVIEAVRERIQAEGALRTSDFENDGPRRGSWWNWKPAKRALEILYNCGELMVADRVNFQRVYDLAERVRPDWVDVTPSTPDEVDRFRVEQAARGMAIGTPQHIARSSTLKAQTVYPLVEDLIAKGVLLPVECEVYGGEVADMLLHRDWLPALEQILDGALQAGRTTFLSPFDSLWWGKGHDQLLWNFEQRLEAYKPAPDRIWGYFCLPILYQDRLVGRFDPKLERKNGTLRLKALYLEPGVAPDEALIDAVAVAMRDFLAWHGATDLVIERSDPAEFGDRLLAAL